MKIDDMKKMNIRGKMKSMKVREKLELPRTDYRPSSIRSTASSLKLDENKIFAISVDSELITVRRMS